MAKILNVFDFDGTLFRSPLDSPQNREKFEKATGIPWLIDKELSRTLTAKHKFHVPMRRGWWGKAETLEPPLVPDPVPPEWFIDETIQEFLNSKLDSDAITVILTGRHAGLQKQVLRILKDGNFVDIQKTVSKANEIFYKNTDPKVQIFFLGMDGPILGTPNKPSETFPWKIWVIEQLITVHASEEVKIWEDRPEHIEKFREQNFSNIGNIIVNEVIA